MGDDAKAGTEIAASPNECPLPPLAGTQPVSLGEKLLTPAELADRWSVTVQCLNNQRSQGAWQEPALIEQ